MRTFKYKTWSGRTQIIGGVDTVQFASGHVVFRDEDGKILLADRNEQINGLVELDEQEATQEDARARSERTY